MLERDIMPDDLKRQTRMVVPTKTVWWTKSIALFVHDFQVLTVVHQALKQLNSREKLTPATGLDYGHSVIVKVFGNWYRARVERLYKKYASLFLIDVGRFLSKVPVSRLLAIENLSETIAFSPGVRVCFLERFHPHRFQIPDPEVLHTPRVQECISRNVWMEKQSEQDNGEDSESSPVSEFPLIPALESVSGENFADRLEPLLNGKYLSERPPVCILSPVELRPIEEVLVVRADGTRLEVQLARFSAEELARLECELSVLEEQELLEKVDVLLVHDLVAVRWNEKAVRGRVVDFGTSTAEICLFDYGILVTRSNTGIWKLPNDLADRLPAYGLRVEARNGAPQVDGANNILMLCDIQFDETANVVTADVFPAVGNPVLTKEVKFDGEYSPAANGGGDESTEKLETSASETATLSHTDEPSLETFAIDAPINQVAIDSLTLSQVIEIEPWTRDPETVSVDPETISLDPETILADPIITPVIESYLVRAEETNGLAVEENGGHELSNEFGPLSDLVDLETISVDPETISVDPETISLDPVITPVIESYLVRADETDGLAIEENGGLELSNEFGPLSDLVDIPPENDESETLPVVENCETIEATSESEQTHLQENYPISQITSPCFQTDHMVNGHQETQWAAVNGKIAERLVSKRSSESDEFRDFRVAERCSRERNRSTVRDQSMPSSNWHRPYTGPHQEREKEARAPPFQPMTSGYERRRTNSKSWNSNPHPRQCSTERNVHYRAASLSQQRNPGNTRAVRGSSVEALRVETSHQIRHTNGHPHQIERKTKTCRCHENEPKWSVHPGPKRDQAATNGVEPDGDSVVIAQEFLVEYVLGEEEGLLLGVNHMRRKSIQEMLSQLPLESLEEIPLHRLKIDQLVLMEHMCGLVRGTVVEITRHKIELKGADQHRVCSATKVFACPDALADPPTTLQEIQLHSPRSPLRCGDLILVNEGKYTSDERLVALSYEYFSRKDETRHFV